MYIQLHTSHIAVLHVSSSENQFRMFSCFRFEFKCKINSGVFAMAGLRSTAKSVLQTVSLCFWQIYVHRPYVFHPHIRYACIFICKLGWRIPRASEGGREDGAQVVGVGSGVQLCYYRFFSFGCDIPIVYVNALAEEQRVSRAATSAVPQWKLSAMAGRRPHGRPHVVLHAYGRDATRNMTALSIARLE